MLSLVTNKETHAIKTVSNFIDSELEKLSEFFGNWFVPCPRMIKSTFRKKGYVWVAVELINTMEVINTMFEEGEHQHKIKLLFRYKDNKLEIFMMTNTNEGIYKQADGFHLACCIMGGAC